MKLLSVLLVMGGLGSPRPSAAPEDKYLETIKVSENVYVFKPKIDWVHGNGVAIIGPDGVFFIDTFIQFNYAEEAIRRLKRVTSLPVTYVLNTHSHDDHAMGNGVFRRIYPNSRLIVHDSAVVGLENRVKARVEGEAKFIAANIAQTDSEVKSGKTTGGTPITGSMKAYWDLSLREALEYKQQYRAEKYVRPDIAFSDTLAMRWGSLTLKMIHMTENGHSKADVIVWIPEQRLLIAGDLVVAPTPYYSLPGITKAVRALIALNPAVIIPGHGPIEHDLSYVKLLERAFSTYQRAADSAIAANVPLKQAQDSITFPDIDRAFIGDDDMKKFTYRSFFTKNVFARAYRDAAPKPIGQAGPNGSRELKIDSPGALELQNVTADMAEHLGIRSLRVRPNIGSHSAGWQGLTEAMAIIPGSDFQNGVIEVQLSGAPMAGAREGSRGFVGIAFRVTPNASQFETFYLRPTNGRADDQLRRNHAAQYQAFPDFQWDRLRRESPGVYESYVDLEAGAWTTIRIVVEGSKARLFVNGAPQPVLVVNDLKLREASGKIALWIGQDTEAYFAKVVVTDTGHSERSEE